MNNLFSQDYDVILNYPMPKRNYRLTLSLNYDAQHTFLYILLLSAVLLSSCREDEVVVPTEYDILPVTVPEGSDVVGMYLLNEGNMGSNKCTLDYLDFVQGYYVRNLYAERNPHVIKELGDVGNDIRVYGSNSTSWSTAPTRWKCSTHAPGCAYLRWTYPTAAT